MSLFGEKKSFFGRLSEKISDVIMMRAEVDEDLMDELKKELTIVIVTHNMQQAVRIADKTAFFLLGELVEYGDTDDIFTSPHDERTERYITGRFG